MALVADPLRDFVADATPAVVTPEEAAAAVEAVPVTGWHAQRKSFGIDNSNVRFGLFYQIFRQGC
jgi:hypothetical protein